MEPYYSDASIQVLHGDCLTVLPELPDNSVDAVVTDPPYGIGFMGKVWDAKAIREALARDKATRKSLGPASDSRPGRSQSRSSSAFGDAAIIAGPVTGGLPFQEWCEQWAAECLRLSLFQGGRRRFSGDDMTTGTHPDRVHDCPDCTHPALPHPCQACGYPHRYGWYGPHTCGHNGCEHECTIDDRPEFSITAAGEDLGLFGDLL